ncbi:Bcr/CflA family multidrug efflux MFS transporter [Candidatus Gracilibacteria bacterium]|nr:Bcr/CflA family multidrug efflux MFS transporter [Candidatus Gracilibacteria bacterium]
MPTHVRPNAVLLIITLGILTATGPFSIDMYLPGLPAIVNEFNADASTVGLTLSLFFIGLAVGQAFYGPLSDRFGRKRPLLIGFAVYTLASVACALTPSLGGLIAMRLLQALGGCAGVVIARSAVRDRFEQREAAGVFSWLVLVTGVAPITAPIIGGQVIAAFGWRAIFWVLAVFGLICLTLTLWVLPETLPRERRVATPLRGVLRIYGGLLADRTFIGYALAGGLFFSSMFAYITGSPFVIIEQYGVAPEQFAWIFGLNASGLVITAQLNRWLLRHYSSDTVLRAALMIAVAAALVLLLAAVSGIGGLFGLLLPLFVCVSCVGLIGPNSTALALAPHGNRAGSASALLGTIQFALGAASGALVGALHNDTALPMAGTIAACILGAVTCYWLFVQPRPPRLQEAEAPL